MALLFRWYLIHTSRLAMEGKESGRLDYQIHCGPAMGAFNQWVRGTPLEDWRNRHVDEIAVMLMQGAAALFEQRLNQFIPGQQDNR
jgi:trans-AT polyketide synthase/acyltransferase/oxidoreductase domain-containing protein